MEDRRPRRTLLKTNHYNWKEKLRENCFKRIREDRNRLLWKMRLPAESSPEKKEIMVTAFREIVSDELKKIKDSSVKCQLGISTLSPEENDALWEYDGLTSQSTPSECEEIMLELQRTFYEDLEVERIRRGQDVLEIWEDEEDDYLAREVFEHMKLSEDQVNKETWCPICKQGKLHENHHIIYCIRCELRLNKGDEVTLDLLRDRLGEAHAEHLDRGCRVTPKFCMETKFHLTALYIQCQACNTFEIIL